ncbi:MAG: hypothetical protein GY938_24605, partial [Ketobacter sp.]|nr:hypothetical protein [Ketobacter sp.]
ESTDVDHKYGGPRITKARETANYLKWLAGCAAPDTFGDRQRLDIAGKVDILHAFSDLAHMRANVVEASAEVLSDDEAPDMPHIAAPDSVPADGE